MAATQRQKVLVLAHPHQVLEPLCDTLAKDSCWEVSIEKETTALVDEAAVNRWLESHQPHYVMVLLSEPLGLLLLIAQACIRLHINYLDISEDPSHLAQLQSLDADAKADNVVLLSGANVFPGLSSVVIDHYAPQFATLREITCRLSPSHLMQGELSDIAAISPGLGQPFSRLEGGVWKTVYGWHDLHRFYYGDNVGYRWHANRHVADLKLLPEKYPDLKSVVFHSGAESSSMHWLLGHVAWLRRMTATKHHHWMTRLLSVVNRWLGRPATRLTAMMIQMNGANEEYQPLEIKWTLVSEPQKGDELGAIIAVLALRSIRDRRFLPGVHICLSAFSLAEFDAMIASRPIYYLVEQRVM